MNEGSSVGGNAMCNDSHATRLKRCVVIIEMSMCMEYVIWASGTLFSSISQTTLSDVQMQLQLQMANGNWHAWDVCEMPQHHHHHYQHLPNGLHPWKTARKRLKSALAHLNLSILRHVLSMRVISSHSTKKEKRERERKREWKNATNTQAKLKLKFIVHWTFSSLYMIFYLI